MLEHLNAPWSSSQAGNDEKGRESITFRVLAIDLLESRRAQAQDKIRKIQDSRIGISTKQESGSSELESTRPPIQVEFLSPDEALPDTCHAVLEVRVATIPTAPHHSPLTHTSFISTGGRPPRCPHALGLTQPTIRDNLISRRTLPPNLPNTHPSIIRQEPLVCLWTVSCKGTRSAQQRGFGEEKGGV
jgi:hypothetical protein